MRVLHVTNCYPYPKDPDYGVFVKRQIDSLNGKIDFQEVVFLNARDKGYKSYFGNNYTGLSKFDVIHCHHVFSLISVFIYAVYHRKPLVVSFLNEFENEIKVRLPKPLLGGVCRLVARFAKVCVYKASLPDAPLANMVYLPNGVDMDYFSPDVGRCATEAASKPPRRKILFVSSKNPNRKQKRLQLFRRVVELLNEKYDLDVEGVVASGLEPDEYRATLRECDLHLLCSEYEGSPNSVKEAMSCNLPVVSTDVGNVREMFGESAYYVVSESSEDHILAERCRTVLGLPREACDGRALLIKNGLDMESVANRLVEIYRNVV